MSKIASKRIGFLVTGSEVTSGEILNSNSAKMAEILQDWGIAIGEHVLCDDGIKSIEDSFRFLLSRHDAVITSGGLGPTSDDVTRIAIANVAKQRLQFYEPSWQKIVNRLSERKLPIPENNRQQAFFPEHATVLPNINGTADGCVLTIEDKLVFMLPGPPRECLPMFKDQVFPMLNEQGFASSLRLFRWRLMGVSESAIAEKLELLAEEFDINFAYRAGYPFVDVKLMLNPHTKNHAKILFRVEQIVKPYFATHLNKTLTEQLHNLLISSQRKIFVLEDATHGYFSQKMALPETNLAKFKEDADIIVSIKGLPHFWKGEKAVFDECSVQIIESNHKEEYFSSQVLLRGQETLDFVAEFTALKILKLL